MRILFAGGLRRAFVRPRLFVSLSLFLGVVLGVACLLLFKTGLLEAGAVDLSAKEVIPSLGIELLNDLRSGKTIQVGTGNRTGFQERALNEPQEGNAVQIYPTTDPNEFIRYYLDTTDNQLKRLHGNIEAVVMEETITNKLIFSAEDFEGNILNNNDHHKLIGINLEFSGGQYSGTRRWPAGCRDGYRLRTKVASRTLE